ncbi:MAG: CBS domain-containing protein [Acetobacteraceae bacterium]
MKVSEAMTREVRIAHAEDTIQHAAQMMAGLDVRALPVGEDDQLVGMITDRDIAIRAVADGKDANTRIRDVMTPDIKFCFEDQDLDEVIVNMGASQIRRVPVINRSQQLVGILSLGDVALAADDAAAGQALGGISRPGGGPGQAA